MRSRLADRCTTCTLSFARRAYIGEERAVVP
jgi:hypothetical protein